MDEAKITVASLSIPSENTVGMRGLGWSRQGLVARDRERIWLPETGWIDMPPDVVWHYLYARPDGGAVLYGMQGDDKLIGVIDAGGGLRAIFPSEVLPLVVTDSEIVIATPDRCLAILDMQGSEARPRIQTAGRAFVGALDEDGAAVVMSTVSDEIGHVGRLDDFDAGRSDLVPAEAVGATALTRHGIWWAAWGGFADAHRGIPHVTMWRDGAHEAALRAPVPPSAQHQNVIAGRPGTFLAWTGAEGVEVSLEYAPT